MNAAIVQRLMWKEYRFLRSFWLATLVLAACAAVGLRAHAAWYERQVAGEDFFVLAAVVSSMFALGAGGTLFATEHETGTAEFLHRLPLDGRPLLWGKMAAAILSILAMTAVLWNAAAIALTWFPIKGTSLPMILSSSIVSEFELFAWATLFSMLTRQPLAAITWGVSIASTIVHLVLPYFFWPEQRYSQSFLLDDYDFALSYRVVMSLLVLVISAALAPTWLRSPQPLSVIPAWLRRLPFRRAFQHSWHIVPKALFSPASPAKGQLARLVWLQWRQSRLLWASLTIPFIASCFWKLTTAPKHEESSLLFAISTGILWLGLGVSVFHGQQAQFRFRYFAEHGILPARVWWGHQLSLLMPLAVSVALTFVVSVFNERRSFPSPTMANEWFVAVLFVASIVFSTGQLVGMLFRQVMVAAAMGIVGLLVHILWLVLLQNARSVNTTWGVLIAFVPMPMAWLLVSRWHVADWILERRTWSARLRLVLGLVGPWMVMATGLMSYRAFEIPNVGIEPPTREQLLTLTGEERETAELYQSVVQSLGIDVEQLTAAHARKQSLNEFLDAMDRQLRQSPEPLAKILAATSRPIGAFAGEPKQQNAVAYLIFRLLVRTEQQAAEQQDVNRLIELFDAQRRLLLHWSRNTDFDGLKHNRFLEDGDNGLIRNLMRQLRASSWQPEQYRELARRIATSNAVDQAVVPRARDREYREALDCLNGGDWPQHFSASDQDHLEKLRWMLWIPGERARARRLINGLFAGQTGQRPLSYHETVRLLELGQLNTPWARVLFDHISHQSPQSRWYSKLLPARWQALQAWLELRAFKAEHGVWPESGTAIPGLGNVRFPGTDTGWIEYLPKGLRDERVSEPFKARGIDNSRFLLNGDEPCLILLPTDRNRMNLNHLINAPSPKDLERELVGLGAVVEPLDPVPAE